MVTSGAEYASTDDRAPGTSGRTDRRAFRHSSHRACELVSSYDGTNGIQARDNLAGTNLSTVPKVFIECSNMRNPADPALVTSPAWQAKAAQAIAAGLTTFLTQR